ncbi:hypothetical protein CK500_07820 [Halorubrum salipaludis]|uniref:Uncharacterized protein n=1 Tax=Halorubrum salipaludis TaxID=2032630 RepID=A0A2A2FFW1_9EURY|nr:hypothetical protein [Halorubrum salipaludis]PAU84326.1 hypothetical protein CK500_07820 [Halorubrum salipaludis]
MSRTNHTTADDPANGDAPMNGDTTNDAATDADTTDAAEDRDRTIHASYAFGVRIREEAAGDGDPVYRFEAPNHEGIAFDDPEAAELYADVYFDVNGFQEAGTGDRGVPPAIIQAGRDTLVGYLLTQPETGRNWVASYYGEKPEKIDRYVARVRKRARLIRERAADRGVAESEG